VLVEGEGPNALRIVALLPRFSAIKRGAAGEHYKQQVIAANIDTVFVVCGLDADFNPRRIERYLMLVGGSGVQPVVVLTKSDQEGADVEAALRELRALGVPVLAGQRAGIAPACHGLEPWQGEAEHRPGGQFRRRQSRR
jgi:ribosome biogenesis GTPase